MKTNLKTNFTRSDNAGYIVDFHELVSNTKVRENKGEITFS